MNAKRKPRAILAIVLVLAVGAVLGWAIVQREQPRSSTSHEHGHRHEEGHEDGDEDHHKQGWQERHGHQHADSHGHGHAGEGSGHHDQEAAAEAIPRGPHGGRLFKAGDYALEVTIFEDGVPPQFRLYTYRQDKPLPPTQSTVTITLERLGRAPELIRFKPVGAYLVGDAEVIEPHSFEVRIEATEGGRTHRFAYEQVEERVTMSDAQLKQAGITIAEAGPARIASSLALLGEVRYNADRTVQVVPRLAGLVEQVLVSAGQPVRKGQVLAVLSSPQLAEQRAQALAAARRVALARATHDREKKLWQEKITAEQDYLQARAALQEAEIAEQSLRQQLAHLGTLPQGGDLTRFALRAPIAGTVTERRLSVGDTVADNAQVFTISDLSTVWVEAPVPAKDLTALKVGRKVRISSDDLPAQAQAQGTISHVSVLLGERTRTATVRVVLPNRDGLWRPGLPVRLQPDDDAAEVAVAVQADAVQTVRDWQVVFLRHGQYLEARPLKLGRGDGRLVEVLEGLSAGERYAAGNSFVVKAELGKAGASHDH